jgi:hypothetical protein
MLDNLGQVLRAGVPVTALYGALCAIFYVAISINVTRNRAKVQVFLEPDKAVPEVLHRAARAQGNATEHLPLALFLLLILELSGAGAMALHIIGGLLLLVRVSHAFGVLSKVLPAQIAGAVGTWLLIVAEAVYVLVLRFR